MKTHIPTAEQLQKTLATFRQKDMERLEQLSGVPWLTIYKIKRGETTNPGIDTVRSFLPHVERVVKERAASER